LARESEGHGFPAGAVEHRARFYVELPHLKLASGGNSTEIFEL
jgi:hypothetical protein